MTQPIEKVCRDAITKWGTTKQVNQCQEECGELIAAINRLRRGRINVEELASEVADVTIMAVQMRLIVEDLGGSVGDQVEKKLKRLVARIEGK